MTWQLNSKVCVCPCIQVWICVRLYVSSSLTRVYYISVHVCVCEEGIHTVIYIGFVARTPQFSLLRKYICIYL